MEIEDAFIQDVIEAAGTDVGGDEETALRAVYQQIIDNNTEVSFPDETGQIVENICMLFFVAGRTHQADRGFTITMSRRLQQRFMEFLVREAEA